MEEIQGGNGMKKAKDMFEEIGYERILIDNYNDSKAIEYTDGYTSFLFVVDKEAYYASCDNDVVWIEMEEHQAIHQQMKELGWIKESDKE